MTVEDALKRLREDNATLTQLLQDADGSASQLMAIGTLVERMATIVGCKCDKTKGKTT